MTGVRDLVLGVRAALALALCGVCACGVLACGVVDVNRPGPPPPCPTESIAPASPNPPPSVPPPKGAPSSSLAPPPPPAVASAKVAPPAASPTCPDDMVTLSAFCIDRYEAPNVAGDQPFSLRTASDGEQWCGARGKRLCSEGEWLRACQGPHGWRYPYGNEHRASACNDDRPWIPVSWQALARWPASEAVAEAGRLFQADVSGARSECVSEEGVYDLTGNVAEWVRRDDPAPRPGYDHVLKGCYWAGCYHEPQPNCAFRNSAHPSSFRTYEAGFRCCRGLEGATASASDPE